MKACFTNNKYTMSIQTHTTQIESSIILIKKQYNFDFKTLLVYKINYLSVFGTALIHILTFNMLLHIKRLYKYIGSYLVQCNCT